jgi:hypothetical protein
MVESFEDVIKEGGEIKKRLVDVSRGKSVLKVFVHCIVFQAVQFSKTVILKGKI